MKCDEILKERMNAVGVICDSIEVSPDVWNEENPIWQNTNNHVFLMLRTYYWKHEKDDEFKKVFGAVLDKMVWLYVSYPEWRARLGWIAWFLNLYILDKQIQKETGARLEPEVWNDPRHWMLTNQADTMNVILEKKNDGPGGLSTDISH